MLDDAVMIGIVIVLTEIVKRISDRAGISEEARKQIVTPLAVLGLAALVSLASAALFEPSMPWREALKQGLVLGAEAGGVYGLGKAALGRS